jgi:hypothetical protein
MIETIAPIGKKEYNLPLSYIFLLYRHSYLTIIDVVDFYYLIDGTQVNFLTIICRNHSIGSTYRTVHPEALETRQGGAEPLAITFCIQSYWK